MTVSYHPASHLVDVCQESLKCSAGLVSHPEDLAGRDRMVDGLVGELRAAELIPLGIGHDGPNITIFVLAHADPLGRADLSIPWLRLIQIEWHTRLQGDMARQELRPQPSGVGLLTVAHRFLTGTLSKARR